MGSDNAIDEQPIHTVYLDAFWIDQTEVTNKQYTKLCGCWTCEPPLIQFITHQIITEILNSIITP